MEDYLAAPKVTNTYYIMPKNQFPGRITPSLMRKDGEHPEKPKNRALAPTSEDAQKPEQAAARLVKPHKQPPHPPLLLKKPKTIPILLQRILRSWPLLNKPQLWCKPHPPMKTTVCPRRHLMGKKISRGSPAAWRRMLRIWIWVLVARTRWLGLASTSEIPFCYTLKTRLVSHVDETPALWY